MNNVFKLDDYRKKFEEDKYLNKLEKMLMPELLEEMYSFNEEFQESKNKQNLIPKGIVLYTQICKACQTSELRTAAENMLGYLKNEQSTILSR